MTVPNIRYVISPKLPLIRRRIVETLLILRARWEEFFNKRCLVGFPWFWPAGRFGERAMLDARRIVRQRFGHDYHPIPRALAKVLVTIAWPPAVLVHLWQIRRGYGAEAVPMKRAPGALWTAMRHNVWPCDYYAYELWHPDRRVKIDNYLYTSEATRLFKVLNRPSQPDPIGDKLAFHDLCNVHVLPTPALLAAFAPTAKLMEFESGRPPERDLFVKPRLGFGGDGAERFHWDGVAFQNDSACRLKPEDLCDYLETRARKENRTLLVQPLLSNHPDLCVANGSLATARLVTGRSTDGKVVAIFGYLYFSQLDQGRWHVEGLIDLTTGRVMSAPLQHTSSLTHRLHQFGSNDGCTLPEWDLALRYAKIAHRVCPNFAFVGWDLAFTNHGPMLLEGNANWSANTYQLLRGEPLGQTMFAVVLATHLRLEIGDKRI